MLTRCLVPIVTASLVMDYATQLHYTHGVPKTSEVVGERISLAFRVKRERAAPDDDAESGFYK
jgi:hypothetical protein